MVCWLIMSHQLQLLFQPSVQKWYARNILINSFSIYLAPMLLLWRSLIHFIFPCLSAITIISNPIDQTRWDQTSLMGFAAASNKGTVVHSVCVSISNSSTYSPCIVSSWKSWYKACLHRFFPLLTDQVRTVSSAIFLPQAFYCPLFHTS